MFHVKHFIKNCVKQKKCSDIAELLETIKKCKIIAEKTKSL